MEQKELKAKSERINTGGIDRCCYVNVCLRVLFVVLRLLRRRRHNHHHHYPPEIKNVAVSVGYLKTLCFVLDGLFVQMAVVMDFRPPRTKGVSVRLGPIKLQQIPELSHRRRHLYTGNVSEIGIHPRFFRACQRDVFR